MVGLARFMGGQARSVDVQLRERIVLGVAEYVGVGSVEQNLAEELAEPAVHFKQVIASLGRVVTHVG